MEGSLRSYGRTTTHRSSGPVNFSSQVEPTKLKLLHRSCRASFIDGKRKTILSPKLHSRCQLQWRSVMASSASPSSSSPSSSVSTKAAATALQDASGISSSKKAWRCSSRVAASLSSTSPEEDSASGSSEGRGAKIDLNLPRRRLQLSFTCDACGARSQRLINPDAYTRGTVFVQCAGCEVYHKLVDNLGLIEEYDFRQETNIEADGADLNGPE